MSLSHATRVVRLYRRALINIRDYTNDRGLFIKHGIALQEQFKANKTVQDQRLKVQLLEEGEAMLETYKHPDPYILMWRPGGTSYHRNPPPVPEVSRLGCLSYLRCCVIMSVRSLLAGVVA